MKITIAVDCGGSHFKIALMNSGKIIADTILPNNDTVKDLDAIVEQAFLLCNNNDISQKDILGMSLSLAGIVDYKKGTLLSSNGKYSWGIDFDFKKWASDNFYSLPVVIENDARLALLGEVSYGVAKGYDNAVLFMLGTGIGTSAIIEGTLLRGVHNQAGILGGHFGCDISAFPCNCGHAGCVEAQVGTWQLPNRLKSLEGFENSTLRDADLLDYKALFHAYENNDKFAIKALDDIIKLWGVGIINLVHAYDPEVVVFSGGVMNSSRHIIDSVSEYVNTFSWTPWGELKYLVANDVNSSPLLGGEALLKESLNIEL